MVIGVGTDLHRITDIHATSLEDNDPFFLSTYSDEEQVQGHQCNDTNLYYATRFAGKEAIFKCLGISPEHIRMNEIRILDDENGKPHVSLTGALLEKAKERDIDEILVTLSTNKDYVIAFALAQSMGQEL